MKLLEVCVDSLASARAAKQGGADRLEFCSALAVGGLTPYADLLRQIKAEMSLPVRCLMRPRAGDFLYTKEEIDLLCHQIKTLHAAGADGFVIGALTPEGTLDLPAMHALLDACDGAPVTLHRCIDVSRDLRETYRAAAALGIDTVLTSGGAENCRKGASQLAELLRLRDELDGPEVLIGAGVNAAVIDELRAALPGGLSDLLLILGIEAFVFAFELPIGTLTTLTTLLLLAVGMAVLWDVCKPFTVAHGVLWGGMLILAGAAIALLGGFLGLERLDMRGMLVLIVFLLLVVQTLHSMERGLTAVGDAAALVWKRLPRKSKAEENY